MKLTYYAALENLSEKIRTYNSSEPLVIAIDGRSASGKTTFAEKLSASIGCPVIHTDDFYRPRNAYGQIEMTEYNGNFDLTRFRDEVIDGIKTMSPFEIGVFDCKTGEITHTLTIPVSKVYIIEGAYSHHPLLSGLKSIKVFFSAIESVRLSRISSRNGADQTERFKTLWMPAEERYFDHYNIISECDIFVDTTYEV